MLIKPSRVTVVIPAYNEAKNLSDVLGPVKQWQRRDPANRHIVVANDGSTDKTAEIASSHGVPVVHSDQTDPRHNVGKAAAIKAGVMQARRNGSEIVVTLDADLKMLNPENIEILHDELAHQAGKDMVIAPTYEGTADITDHMSGQRAMRMKALAPWLRGTRKWDRLLQGYGFETGINELLGNRCTIIDPGFHALQAYRGVGGQRQHAEIFATRGEIWERGELAKRIFELRRRGERAKAKSLLAEYHRRPP